MSNRLKIAQMSVAPGEKTRGYLSLGQLADGSPVNMPVSVIRGKQTGPRLFLTAGVHATEAEGVEVARRIINMVAPETLRGVLLVVPVVNVLGFRHSPAARYSPVWLEEEARGAGHGKELELNARRALADCIRAHVQCLAALKLPAGLSKVRAMVSGAEHLVSAVRGKCARR